MKKNAHHLILACFVASGLLACKGERENPTDPGVPETPKEATADASTYIADTENSLIHWKGRKPTGAHTGTVQLASGTLQVREREIAGGEFVIDMTSLTVTDLTGDSKERLENHLKGTAEGKEEDFFNVTSYPTASFVVTGVKTVDAQTWLQGNLTIKEITRNIEFPVNITFEDTTLRLYSEPFQIDRTQWDINFRSKSVFDDLGDSFIYDDIELEVKLIAEKET